MVLAVTRMHETMDMAVVDSYWNRSRTVLHLLIEEKQSTGLLDFLFVRSPVSLVSFPPPTLKVFHHPLDGGIYEW